LIKDKKLQERYGHVPLKKVPVRVAKYEVELRENPLRAAQAMHAILSRMVLFTCNDCKERFPTFHPAYVPPPAVAKDMEILKRGHDGVAACNVEVSKWDELPPLEAADGVATCCSGTCLRCQKDMDEQLKDQGGDESRGQIVALLSEDNHMDPCFRFPWDDLKDLFEGATMTEAMLLALEHMQVNFVTVSSGLRKFRRNTLSFPQDIVSFSERLGLMKNYRPGDRVNSVRGVGQNPRNPDREVRRVTDATPEERERYAVDAGGALIIPGRVLERFADGLLLVKYDHGGEGLERPENVTPRLTMPWHPKDVPLHLMLRRSVGRGRDALEGLHVRWWYVANLLQALCAFPRNGYGPWRMGGKEQEPMHKYYDPRLFHVMDEAELKEQYAPKEVGGVVLEPRDAEALTPKEKLARAVDVTRPEHFIAAGFDVNFVGPEEELPLKSVRVGGGEAVEGSGEPGVGGSGEDAGVCSGEVEPAPPADGGCVELGSAGEDDLYVDEETFCLWLDCTEFPFGYAVQRWWADLATCEEGAVEGVKSDEDETTVELFRRMREDVVQAAAAEAQEGVVVVKDQMLWLPRMVEWLEQRMGPGLGSGGQGVAEENVVDEVLHELTIAARFKGGDDDRGCVKEPVELADAEEEALRSAERLVYGWPSRNDEPTGVRSAGRFAKAFPLDFPMGIGDLYEDRQRKVPVDVWVQHLLRYKTGHFVGGLRGQRVLWAMVNCLLLSEARARGFGIYRNVVRRAGLGLEGGQILTKQRLREILESEDRMRVLVGQLSTVGREVRSTTMQWAYEGKKLESTVKHLSWVPPWVDAGQEEDWQVPVGRRFLGEDSKPVPDELGLGRHPSLWWTLNCKYNDAYDVQRMNTTSAGGDAALDERSEGDKQERFRFTRDNPDLVAYMLALRTELHMRMVMPAIVPHSDLERYMSMARFETGPGGNPHWHGFGMGAAGPKVERVEADVEGEGDVPPQTLPVDVRTVLRAFRKESSDAAWDFGVVRSKQDVFETVRDVLARAEGSDDEQDGESGGSESDAPSAQGEGVAIDLLGGRVAAVVRALVEQGELEALTGESAEEQGDVKYRRVPPVPKAPAAAAEKKAGRPPGAGDGVREQRLTSSLADLGIMKPENEEKQLQSSLEEQFDAFFKHVVSEWNPCKSEDGRWRYKWDEEIGAHDVDVDLEEGDAAETVPSERRAVLEVSARAPGRVNLRGLLDNVFGAGGDAQAEVDVQRVRRLVAALVNGVARHTKHGILDPQIGVHACARGKESCPKCRYGFPRTLVARGGARPMIMERGEREGQWHARFPRNDKLCCSYEAHVLLANMGNIDWRPVLNLWAVVQYVTKYATKAPKGSRKLNEVLKDAVDEVCTYVPEGEGADFLRRSIQKFFARTLGERDFHAYEAMHLGLQLPLVIPLMPVVSLNTSGARPLKAYSVLKEAPADTPVHYDSRVDKFNKRLQLVRKQIAHGDGSIQEAEVRDVSLYEFWWKFAVYRGRVKRSTRPVCLMVTPCFSADCANVEHASHESYARAAVIAYWRHMATAKRHGMIRELFRAGGVQPVAAVCFGATQFVEPFAHAGLPDEDTYLGIRDLYMKFEGVRDRRGVDEGWGLALMEMLTDPMLKQWVPAWVVEQFRRANPFYQEVLTALQAENLQSNRALLKKTKQEMIRRHRRHLQKIAEKKANGGAASSGDESGGVSEGASTADERADVDAQADELAAKLAGERDDDPHAEPVEMLRDVRPQAGGGADAGEEDPTWARRSAEERLSAAGAAARAPDRVMGAGMEQGAGGSERAFGVLFNPRDYPWTEAECNVHWNELKRLEESRDKWYGKAFVGDGADAVERSSLDPMQKFAHDIVMDARHSLTAPLRLMLLGSAGTGKSRTVRSFVGARRERVRRAWDDRLHRATLSAGARVEADSRSSGTRAPTTAADGHRSVAELLGVSAEEVAAAVAALNAARGKGAQAGASKGAKARKEPAALAKVKAQIAECVRNACLLAAPTGCASFQLKFGASTLHRIFGIPVGYCGPWNNRADGRYLKMKTRMDQARLFVMDEMSMVGRQMLGKIEFKVRDTLRTAARDLGEDATLAGRDTVLAGDPKQANPIGDDPLYREGDYSGKGQNKPRGSDRTPSDAWTSHKLVRMGMLVRNSFEDAVLLRQVHRYVEASAEIPEEKREEYRQAAKEFLSVTRGMADCTWTQAEHAWLSRRNRTLLQQTPEGRAELKRFDTAPLLMDGRKDRVTGEVGANKINQLRLERLSAQTQKPIAVLRALHDKPNTASGKKMKPETMDADDFRGMESELLVCEGARVLLTQNLWVEAGLMNGALGVVRGYMWPEGGNPYSERSELRTPLCVFVEFDSVNLGVDEEGRPRSFFPNDPVRHNWVPIFRQKVSSTAEEHVARENFPLQLAWALTHWKAQGMTLDRVRVHLSARTAGVPGIGFVACTRVRHPWDLVFEEDLPEYEHFMKARRTPAFRERRRFELRMEARASRTLRRYGYCEADLWTAEERAGAQELLRGLKGVADEQRGRLRKDTRVDADTWLWGDGEPDYEGELAAEVARIAAGDAARQADLQRLADRLLDRLRVRRASEEERDLAAELLAGSSLCEGEGSADVWRRALMRRAEVLASGDAERRRRLEEVADQVARRVARSGRWDDIVDDSVPAELQPLHMSAVREVLGALIPARLHRSLDKAVKKGKDDFGAVRGDSVLYVDGGWRVSVRAEDALARGRLQEDALEFFLAVLKRVCQEMKLPLAVGSKTVGREVGRQETPAGLARVMQKWRKVWPRDEVRQQVELVLPVAFDDKPLPQDWVCVVVRSCVAGEKLGDAKRLHVEVHDASQRVECARRVARNLDVLVRGVEARASGEAPRVEVVGAPDCRVPSQRILVAFGLLLARVAAAGQEVALDSTSESFVPDVSHALRALFGHLRKELGERGLRDVSGLLKDAQACRDILRRFGTVPSLTPSRVDGGVPQGSGAAQGGSRGESVAERRRPVCAARVVTWNIAGGHKSAQAPETYNAEDQRAKVMSEILRWSRSYRCDVIALQECERPAGYEELLVSHELAGSTEAVATRGHVHLYVRRGVQYSRMDIGADTPCVAVRLCVGEGDGGAGQDCAVVAAHLPTGDCAGSRERILKEAVRAAGDVGERLVLIGDMNVKDDVEVESLCRELQLHEARYAGFSWGVKSNAFYKDSQYSGPGLRKDRVLFGKRAWAEAHLVGQGKMFFDGCEFCLSDHFGVMAYVDVGDVYASRAKQDCVTARVRRGQLVSMREQAQQKELLEVKASCQAGREGQALARLRALQRGRAEYQRAQDRGARQRLGRRVAMRRAAFGTDSLFAVVETVPALSTVTPCAPTDVFVPSLDEVGAGSWLTTKDLPLRGMRNVGNTCYVNSMAQVLMRVPAMVEWATQHVAENCPQEESSCVLCALFRTYCQVLAGFGRGAASVPVLAERRAQVHDVYRGAHQHDVVEFFEHFLDRARSVEIAAGRCGAWGGLQMDRPVATHVERIFGFVRETRRRCLQCRGNVRSWYSSECVLRLSPEEVPGGPMTVSEMYFASCARDQDTLRCGVCGVDTAHESQSRMFTAPNVLVVQVRRRAGPRVAVGVEEQLDVPGLPVMELAGVMYHNGRTFQEGHYMALCRGPGGRFWFYDDNRPVLRRPEEVAHIRPRQAYMLVYCRRDGSATWQRRAAVPDIVDVDGGDGGGGDGHGGGRGAEGRQNARSSSGHVPGVRQEGESPKRRRLTRKRTCEGGTDTAPQVDDSARRACGVADGRSVSERRVGSPVIPEATTPERVAKASRVETSGHDADAARSFGAETPKRTGDAVAVGDAGATPRRAGTPPHRLRSKTPTRVGSPVLDGACGGPGEVSLHAAGSGLPRNQLRGVTDEAELAETGRGQLQRTVARGGGGRGQSRGMSGQGKGRGRGQHGAGALTEEHAAAAPRRSSRVAARAAEQRGDVGRR